MQLAMNSVLMPNMMNLNHNYAYTWGLIHIPWNNNEIITEAYADHF